jgi:RNA polymerase sigma factor (sigma-70 family)
MDSPLYSAARVDTDALLLHIETMALAQARDIVPKHAVGDVAHDVVLHCLVKMREGNWDVPPHDVTRHVRRMVLSRAVDDLRGRHRRDGRELIHGRELTRATHAWMSPEVITEERVLGDLLARKVAELPPRCRRAYVMVRERSVPYKAAAKLLGISPSAVSRHVVRAQRYLRSQLLASGIAAPPPRLGRPSGCVDAEIES